MNTIEEIIDYTIEAIYSNRLLAKQLVLKGGSAMRLLDNQRSRLSIDADFSIEKSITNESAFFARIERTLCAAFKKKGLDLIDFKSSARPNKRKKSHPEWWKGWKCEFKLVSHEHSGKTIDTRRRQALIPKDSNSSKMVLDISEHEYCGKRRTKRIHGTVVSGYSRELIVVEKIRSLCQQHPDYPYKAMTKNRSRDLYDIYQQCQKFSKTSITKCKKHLRPSFEAKDVSLELLKALWNDDFCDELERGFEDVKATVEGKLESFEVYLENLRFLIKEIYPEVAS
jgi:predicted nucleotidyltransferase component of viral defense system